MASCLYGIRLISTKYIKQLPHDKVIHSIKRNKSNIHRLQLYL